MSQPKTPPTTRVAANPAATGQCSTPMKSAPKTEPSMPSMPAVKLMTFEVEYMTLYANPIIA